MKKAKPVKKSAPAKVTSPKKYTDPTNTIHLVILSLYFIVELIPFTGIIDQMAGHWLAVAVLNLLSLGYIAKNADTFKRIHFPSILKNAIPILLLIFFVISGLSIFVAVNKVESIVWYANLATMLIMFFVFYLLLFKRLEILKHLALVIAVGVFIQAFNVIVDFHKGIGVHDLDKIILDLKSTFGNKNTFGIVLTMKIPIVIYLFFVRGSFVKYFAILTILLAILANFFINSRTSYLAIIVELLIVVIGFAIVYFREKRHKKYLLHTGAIIVSGVIALLISQSSIDRAIAASKSDNILYGSVTERLGELTDTSADVSSNRLAYWKRTLEHIKKSPFIGVGYGNFKFHSQQFYVGEVLDAGKISKHPHNDFIEIAAESGVMNTIVYLLLFGVATFFSFRVVFSSRPAPNKLIAIIGISVIGGYFVDAFFNYPIERPISQVFFAFSFAVVTANYLAGMDFTGKKDSTKALRYTTVGLLIVLGGVLYVNYTVYKSFAVQYKIVQDLTNLQKNPPLPANAAVNEINPFAKTKPAANTPKLNFTPEEAKAALSWIPNIDQYIQPHGYNIARYLSFYDRNEDALEALREDEHVHPNNVTNYYMKVILFNKLGQQDSIYHYAKLAFEDWPRNVNYYKTAINYAGRHNDTTAIFDLYDTHKQYHDTKVTTAEFIRGLAIAKYKPDSLKVIIDSAEAKYPGIMATLQKK